MRGGRHIRYAEPTPLANLHLTLLDKVGVRLDSFADSQGQGGRAVCALTNGADRMMRSTFFGVCAAAWLLSAVNLAAATRRRAAGGRGGEGDRAAVRTLLQRRADVNAPRSTA